LFVAAVQMPAYVLGFGQDEVASLERYAQSIGFAFQITDDLLDARTEAEDLDKSTFVSLLGTEGARERVKTLVSEAVQAVQPFGVQAKPLQELAAYVGTRAH